MYRQNIVLIFFFFNDTATTEIYTLSLHDALPISKRCAQPSSLRNSRRRRGSKDRVVSSTRASRSVTIACCRARGSLDRKSTRLNSSHANISYAVFCLKKKKK